MPKLLVFAPCEKVIISQDENNPTLIAILSDLGGQYQLQDGDELSENVILPLRWAIFAMWAQEPNDGTKTFTQRLEFWSPTGKQVVKKPDAEFSFEKAIQRVVMYMPGLPVGGGNGTWTLKVYLVEKGLPYPTEPAATYPLNIQITKIEESEKAEKA